MTDSLQSWEYLERLQGVELHRLYRSPPSTLAVFRKVLSGLAKHFVMSMLYCPRPTLIKDFELMTKASSSKARQMALEQLRRYHIVRDVTLKTGKAYALVPDFAKSLRQVLGGVASIGSFGEVVNPSASEVVSIDELDDYAREQWEGILGYMVGSSSLADLQEPGEELPAPSPGVIELLRAGDLVKLDGTASRGYTPHITNDGFAFVLKDVNTQIWALLFLYVENAEALSMDKVEVLSFIFFVASLELGLAYSTSSFTPNQLAILHSLSSLGIIYQPPPTSTTKEVTLFYPTRLATSLTSTSAATLSTTSTTLGSSLQQNSALSASHTHNSTTPSSTSAASPGFIIIETNYRLYAYTSSPLQIALLSLFITLRSRHPNLVTGKLTKSSVQRAIRQGITADQIISYLTTHAHPQMRRHAAAEQTLLNSRALAAAAATESGTVSETQIIPVVPATILDQIHLWQLEKDRMTSLSGYLLKEFGSLGEYSEPCRYADETGVLLWKDDAKRMFFVSRIEGVQGFIRERRERGGG